MAIHDDACGHVPHQAFNKSVARSSDGEHARGQLMLSFAPASTFVTRPTSGEKVIPPELRPVIGL